MATVADIMDRDPVTVTAGTSIEELVRVLKQHQVQGVPVVNEGGRCVGIVTEEDLVLADEQGDLHLPHYIELFGGVVFLEPLRRFDERLRKALAATVGDLMTKADDLVTVAPGASVHEAGRLIAARHHNRLPVVEHGRLVGVVTRIDVLQALTSED
ncbi:MAG TPA: CBS domain-containing protein [Solirubrobacteraceae bacterium]|jgi:CBS domain-containing protein|nr:CBS domain-containing protein [Solirubrobacteraceae bacterium]